MRKTNTKKDFQRLHIYYQKLAYTRLNKEFKKLLKGIPYSNLNYQFPEAIIALNINDDNLERALKKMYLDIGLKYGKHVNRDIEMETKAAYPLFSDKFIKWVTDYFTGAGGNKVVTLTKTMTKRVMTQISNAQKEGLTQSQMIREVEKNVTKSTFYRSGVMRIVRTESLTAMNTAKQISFDESDIKVNKEWILGGSANHRIEHVEMDGVQVPNNEKFTLPSGEKLKYPGDPNGSAGEIINCSCSFGYKPVRDSNGELVMKSLDISS